MDLAGRSSYCDEDGFGAMHDGTEARQLLKRGVGKVKVKTARVGNAPSIVS